MQSAGTVVLLLLGMFCLISPARVQCQSESEEQIYIRKLQEAYNASGIPWDQELDDSIELLTTGIPLDCNTDIEAKATNVNELTPADIKVVGALGDSITAAMGAEAKTIITALREYRGVSWSIGGDGDLDSYVTLPNIIKKYNPDVKGFSVAYGGPTSNNAKNNVAISGATADGMPGQARTLVDKIKADPDINYEEDWKLVTLWIGGNDLCAVCKGEDIDEAVRDYERNVTEALKVLKELPRTFVNLVKILDVTEIVEVYKEGGLICAIVHNYFCSCGISDEERERTSKAQTKFNIKLQEIAKQDEFHRDDFTVVVQPFMEKVESPRKEDGKVDMSYFAIDCFHFRTKGHCVSAAALWNNMVEPVGSKADNWNLKPKLKCPKEGAPYFYTKQNSQSFGSFAALPNDQGANGEASGSVNLLAVLLGVGVALLVTVLVVVGGVMGAVLWRKRRQHQRTNLSPGTVVCDTEKVYLIRKN